MSTLLKSSSEDDNMHWLTGRGGHSFWIHGDKQLSLNSEKGGIFMKK